MIIPCSVKVTVRGNICRHLRQLLIMEGVQKEVTVTLNIALVVCY